MSDLSAFRDHARTMSTAEHKGTCQGRREHHNFPDGRLVYPDPACPGCVSDADRALWARLADEVDAYLSHDEDEVLL